MAVCGHCGKHVAGIRDHIRSKHFDEFYQQGPDGRYYSYRELRKLGLAEINPRWDARYAGLTQARFVDPVIEEIEEPILGLDFS